MLRILIYLVIADALTVKEHNRSILFTQAIKLKEGLA